MRSAPVTLPYDLATASNDGTRSTGGFDGKGNALPAEMLPAEITLQRRAVPAGPGQDRRAQRGCREGTDDRSAAGSVSTACTCWPPRRTATRRRGSRWATRAVDLNIQDWGGFIGQWDDRQWVAKDTRPGARLDGA